MPTEPSVPSFIPKQEDAKSAKRQIDRIRSYLNAAMFIGTMLFTLAIVGAVLAFLFDNLASDELSQSKTDLLTARDQFQPNEILQLNRFSNRLEVVGQLLSEHRRLAPVFAEIEDHTLEVIQLKNAEIAYNDDNSLTVAGEGEAADFASLALQSDEFSNSEFLSNPIFSNFQRNNDDDLVSFQYTINVNARLTEPLSVINFDNENDTDVTDSTSESAEVSTDTPNDLN